MDSPTETRPTEQPPPKRPPTSNNSSVGHIVKEIAEDLSSLFQKEIELAKGELAEIARSKGLGAALMLTALVIGILILPFALLSLIEVLTIWLPRWGSTLIVTGLMMILGVAAFLVARTQFRKKLLPKETLATLKEDIQWAKNLKK